MHLAMLPRKIDSSGHAATGFFPLAMLPRKVDSSGHVAQRIFILPMLPRKVDLILVAMLPKKYVLLAMLARMVDFCCHAANFFVLLPMLPRKVDARVHCFRFLSDGVDGQLFTNPMHSGTHCPIMYW